MKADLAEIPTEFGEFDGEDETVAMPVPLDPAVYDGMYPAAWEEIAARQYLQGRKVGKEAAETMGLLFDPEERRILFPIIDREDQLFGFSGRSILPASDMPRGTNRHRDYEFKKEHFLLGENLYQKGKPIWLVEGLFAYAHMIEIGARAIVNPMAPMMSALSPFQMERLVDMDEKVYLCFDPDKAGDQGLFGTQLADGTFKGGGVVDKVRKELTAMVPPFPEELDDIDNCTYRQFLWMFNEANFA